MKILLLIIFAFLLNSCSDISRGYSVETISELNEPFKKNLKIPKFNGDITYLNLHIVGEIKGKAELRFYHSPFNNYSKIDIEGKVDKKYTTDWYENDILFEYIPKGKVDGQSIHVYYRFK